MHSVLSENISLLKLAYENITPKEYSPGKLHVSLSINI